MTNYQWLMNNEFLTNAGRLSAIGYRLSVFSTIDHRPSTIEWGKTQVFLLVWGLLITLLGSLNSFAQSTYIPLGNAAYHFVDRIEIKGDSLDTYLYTSTKPYNRLYTVLQAEASDEMVNAKFRKQDRYNQYYIYEDSNEWTDWGLVESDKPLWKRFYKYRSDFFHQRTTGEELIKVNPVLNLSMAAESQTDDFRFQNTKGLSIRGMINDKVGFYSVLTDNVVSFPQHTEDFLDKYGGLPGFGRCKPAVAWNGLAAGYDFWDVRGYVSFQATDRIGIQFGQDRNFIGNGYRSLFLSDFAKDYFFLKVNTKIWHFNYQNLFMELTGQFDNKFIDQKLPKKYASLHHLSVNLGKRLNVGVFEGVVFGRDSGFELNYLNPVIFYRAVEFHLGSSDNVILGADFKYNFLKRFSAYGQLVMDEFNFNELFRNRNGWWANKYGYQLGLKYIDVANVSNLDAQMEYNTVRPYTYSHNSILGNEVLANYTHFNQPLAHPFGANFKEWMGILRYRPNKKWSATAQLMATTYGDDSEDSNWGGNIFLDSNTREQEFDNEVGQGIESKVLLGQATVSYMWKHNVFLDFNYFYRQHQQAGLANVNNQYLGLGVRVNAWERSLLY